LKSIAAASTLASKMTSKVMDSLSNAGFLSTAALICVAAGTEIEKSKAISNKVRITIVVRLLLVNVDVAAFDIQDTFYCATIVQDHLVPCVISYSVVAAVQG